jgi:hypothetical protein
MDGIAAIGIATPYSREDHVHPSDTSRVIKAGDTMTGTLVLAADPVNPSEASTKNYVDTQITSLNEVYVNWVPYTGPPQTFRNQDMTRDGDWTMIANKDTNQRPAPQATGPTEDLLPDTWTPTTANARAGYTIYNEWTLSQAGWIDQHGVDVLAQNVNALHAVTLTVNGVTRDHLTFTPSTAGVFWVDITPMLVVSGAVLRETLQLTQTANNVMYWVQQSGLFATPPTNCSLAVGSKDGAAAGTTAYGAHLQFIPGAASPDWEIVAYGGTASGGGMLGVPEAPTDGQLYGRENAAWSVVPAPGPPPINYSTSEQWTGLLWLDGKKIYQRTINFGVLPNTATANVAHGIANISYITLINLQATGSGYFSSIFVSATSANIIGCYVNGTDIFVETGSNRSSWNAYVTLQYTCTDR